MSSQIRVGTRGSLLARTQSTLIAQMIDTRYSTLLVVIKTEGDNLDISLTDAAQPGLFVNALREALLMGEVDCIVHSFKDLPSADHPDLELVAIPQREDNRDVLISKGFLSFNDLSAGALVGTSSPRRQAAIRHLNPGLEVRAIRGNIDSRIRKVRDGEFDAVILASAGVIRLGLESEITDYFSIEEILPAPAQGALAVECRKNDSAMLHVLAPLDDQLTRLTTTAERAILRALNAGCDLAIGAFAQLDGERLTLIGEIGDPLTGETLRHFAETKVTGPSDFQSAELLGQRVASHLQTSDLGKRIWSRGS